jgi:hypothetical protein
VNRNVRADWQAAILICAKCTRKVGGGFGEKGRTPLAKALRAWVGGPKKGRKARIGAVEVPCLKICPKRAVTVVDGARPREWLVIDAGTPVAEVAARLGIAASPLAVQLGRHRDT